MTNALAWAQSLQEAIASYNNGDYKQAIRLYKLEAEMH